MSEPWLSIVTVVRDDETGLRRTLASISEQTADGYQVVVIDSSRDHNAVRDICSGVATVSWTEPQGVYPAMNEGLRQATGSYVQFLNAGDELHNSSVLSRAHRVAAEGAPWMFGPVIIVGANGESTITPPWHYPEEKAHLFARGYFPQHQGTFVQRDRLVELGGFSDSYQIAADYEMILRLSQVVDPVELDFVIADFHEGGISSSHWRQSFQEFHRARREVFRPTGVTRVREQWDTFVHWSRVSAYREVVAPLRRRARR